MCGTCHLLSLSALARDARNPRLLIGATITRLTSTASLVGTSRSERARCSSIRRPSGSRGVDYDGPEVRSRSAHHTFSHPPPFWCLGGRARDGVCALLCGRGADAAYERENCFLLVLVVADRNRLGQCSDKYGGLKVVGVVTDQRAESGYVAFVCKGLDCLVEQCWREDIVIRVQLFACDF